MNYEQMSDFEINKAVSKIMGTYRYIDSNPSCSKELGRNYCTSWSAAGPIIAENGISIIKDAGLHLWVASSNAYWADGSEWQIGQEVMHENPLRAAMMVFLMMQSLD